WLQVVSDKKKLKTKMASKIVCDQCSKSFELTEWYAHYEECSDRINAFEVLMTKGSSYQEASTSGASKRPRLETSLEKANITCTTCGERYLPFREMRHILSEKHKNATAA
ncbi:Hypothetical predicted protein, partial [Drosophila guanche]